MTVGLLIFGGILVIVKFLLRKPTPPMSLAEWAQQTKIMRLTFSTGIFMFCIVQHIVWGVSLIASPEPVHTTSIDKLYSIIQNQSLLGMALALIAMGALWEIKTVGGKATVFIFLQQFVLLLSAWGAMDAIVGGHFADMVIRSRYFILSDQVHHVILAALHTWGIFYYSHHG